MCPSSFKISHKILINNLNINPKMQQRKYITVQRSAQKEPPRASYQIPVPSYRERQTYDTNFHGDINRYSSNNTNLVKTRVDRERQQPKMKYSQLHKSPSESTFKNREQYVKGNIIRRRGDGMVSNLKSELQNLKLEVSKLMNKDKDSDTKSYSSRKMPMRAEEDDLDSENISLSGYSKELSDTISVTSEKIIDEPLRRLESKFSSTNYDHTHYMQLENQLLKTQLRNLKNKYNATKQDLRQKCEALEKKNQYLQISLRRSEETLMQCKKSLQVEVQTIKFQLTRKLQQQYEEEQKRSERLVQPVRDNLGENQFVQEKISKLYEELSEKSKALSTMNMDLNETRGLLQKKSFQLKKQQQKNSQLSKQLQFSKRQSIRNKNLLELELSKKQQQTKTIQTLRQKLSEQTKQLNLHTSIVSSSEQLQSKYAIQLKQYKQNEQKLRDENYQYQNQVKKLKQLNDVNQEEIKHLKKIVSEYTQQNQQLMKNVKAQREKAIEVEENYRKLLDQTKQAHENQLEILQKQFDDYREHTSFSGTEAQIPSEQPTADKFTTNINTKQKDHQITKWKAQYKMLKLKFEEYIKKQNNKKDEIETYYKNYKQYKNKNKILEMRNKVLEESTTIYIQKIQKIQAEFLEQKVQSLEKLNAYTLENQQLQRKIKYLDEQLVELRQITENEIQRANNQQITRKEIQSKVLQLDIENNEQLQQVIERIKKRISEQDQKINKYIKEMKNKDNLIKQLKKQIRTILENQQKQLQQFRIKQITESIQQMKTKNYASLEDLKIQSKKQLNIQVESNKELINQNTKNKIQINKLEDQIKGLKEQVRVISQLYNLKCTEQQQILDKKQKEISNYSNKIEEIQRIKNQAIKNLQLEILNKNQQIQNNRIQIKKYLTINKMGLDEQNFNQALKAQIEGSKKLREELNKKNEEVYRIRDSYAILKTQLDNLKSQYDISKLRFISDKKNIQVQFEVQSQNLKTSLSLEQKKVTAFEQKIKIIVEQNKKKDNFIQTYIMGKKLPTNQRQILTTFLKQYQICLSGKQISSKLQSQSQQLQKMTAYNYNLMKEIAEMKEKLSVYEAVSGDNDDAGGNSMMNVEVSLHEYEGIKNFD